MSQFVNANGKTLLNLKFSLKEQETGMQWIDGKKIYCKVILVSGIDKNIIKSIIKVGLPAGIEKLIMRLGQLVYNSMIISIGMSVYVAHNISNLYSVLSLDLFMKTSDGTNHMIPRAHKDQDHDGISIQVTKKNLILQVGQSNGFADATGYAILKYIKTN